MTALTHVTVSFLGDFNLRLVDVADGRGTCLTVVLHLIPNALVTSIRVGCGGETTSSGLVLCGVGSIGARSGSADETGTSRSVGSLVSNSSLSIHSNKALNIR